MGVDDRAKTLSEQDAAARLFGMCALEGITIDEAMARTKIIWPISDQTSFNIAGDYWSRYLAKQGGNDGH